MLGDMFKKTNWRSARDPKTGREYYYNKVTKESTWTKPMELASEAERYEMEKKKRETVAFFKDMERNIFKSFEEAKKREEYLNEAGFTDMYEFDDDNYDDQMDEMLRNSVNSYRDGCIEDLCDQGGSARRRGSIGGLRLVRTISSIDDDIMEMMKRSKSEFDFKLESNLGFSCSPASPLYGEFRRMSGVSPLDSGIASLGRTPSATPPARSRVNSLTGGRNRGSSLSKEGLPPTGPGFSKTNAFSGFLSPAIVRKRRNSTGTLYIDSTMSQQDNKAMMRCVCAVIQAHMIDAEKDNVVPQSQFDIFKDEYYVKIENQQKRQQKNSHHVASPLVGLCAADRQVPSLSTIVNFFEGIFAKSQMENECIIMSLIYIERLIKVTKGKFCIRFDNWRSTSFACMIMASKVWDDLSMWNVDFSQISESFDLQRINELELAVLEALKYEVKVPAGEYAKYYFHLRSMIARLGYHTQRETELKPLNVDGARKLQLATEEYANNMMDTSQNSKDNSSIRGRARSLVYEPDSDSTDIPTTPCKLNRHSSADAQAPRSHQKARSVLLEHLLHSTHIHGDGGNTADPSIHRTPSKKSLSRSSSKQS